MLVPVLCRCFWLFIAIVYHFRFFVVLFEASSSLHTGYKLSSNCHHIPIKFFQVPRFFTCVSSSGDKIHLISTRKRMCRYSRGFRTESNDINVLRNTCLFLLASAFGNYSSRSLLDHYVTEHHPASYAIPIYATIEITIIESNNGQRYRRCSGPATVISISACGSIRNRSSHLFTLTSTMMILDRTGGSAITDDTRRDFNKQRRYTITEQSYGQESQEE